MQERLQLILGGSVSKVTNYYDNLMIDDDDYDDNDDDY